MSRWAQWIGGIVGYLIVLGLSLPVGANIITYKFVNASASFLTDATSCCGVTNFTLDIDGTFSYDDVNLVATAVNVTLSGAIPPQINQFEAFPYTQVCTGLGFSGFPPRSFCAENAPFDDEIAVGFAHSFDNSADP